MGGTSRTRAMTQEEKAELLKGIEAEFQNKRRQEEKTYSSGGVSLSWGAEHRDVFCSVCRARLIQDPKIPPGSKRIDENYCPRCSDYRLGRLIVRQATVQP